MEFGQVHHIEYYVDDLALSNAFWDWFMPRLGYEKTSAWSHGVSWTHAGGTYLVFVQVEDAHLGAGNNRQGAGLNHIAFMGGSSAGLDALQADLVQRGIAILKRDGTYLCFEDPNAFAVEVYAQAET